MAGRSRGPGGAERSVRDLLAAIVPREALADPELAETPARVAEALREDLLDGYRCDPGELLARTIPHRGRDLVAVTGIDFHAMCPHHLLPYRGTATVAYVPRGKVVGLGLLARLVDCHAHRLVIEEVLARRIAESLALHLGAPFAACVLDAEQMCLTMRGERRRSARVHAQAFAGERAEDRALQRRVLALATPPRAPRVRR